MVYFLRRLLALSIMTSLLGIALLSVGTTPATDAALILLKIGVGMSILGLVLAVGHDAKVEHALRRRCRRFSKLPWWRPYRR
jgi:hypothetical protein